jgi:hypothetical protein
MAAAMIKGEAAVNDAPPSKRSRKKKRPSGKPGPRPVRFQIGVRPRRATVEERGIGGHVRMLVRIDGARVWKKLSDAKIDGIPVADLRLARNGDEIDEESRTTVELTALKLQRALVEGRNPWGDGELASASAPTAATTPASAVPQANPHTLRWLEQEALSEDGRFMGANTHIREQRANLALYLPRIIEVIGRDLPISQLTQRHLELYWRTAARNELRAADPKPETKEPETKVKVDAPPISRAPKSVPQKATGWKGFRSTEMALELLMATINWAERRFAIQGHAVSRTWRQEFTRDWCSIRALNAKVRTLQDTPRYSNEEIGLFTLGIEQRKGDPRIRRAVDLAGEQRVGQAIDDCMRSHLDLKKGEHGMLIILGEGRKEGAEIDLTADQRARLDYDLAEGDLADLEVAYQKQLIADYPMFPGWINPRTKQRVALDRLKPITRRYAKRLFVQFEAACGIEHQPGRGWKGIRAWGSDSIRAVGLQLGVSEDIIRNAQGWARDSRTAEKHYRSKLRDAERAIAAKLREAARGQARTLLPHSVVSAPPALEHPESDTSSVHSDS